MGDAGFWRFFGDYDGEVENEVFSDYRVRYGWDFGMDFGTDLQKSLHNFMTSFKNTQVAEFLPIERFSRKKKTLTVVSNVNIKVAITIFDSL